MPSVGAMPGLIGRKVGMMTLYDGGGRARGVTVIEVAGNRVTQIRTSDRDGYEAIQVGAPGKKKKLTRPERGHLADSRRPVNHVSRYGTGIAGGITRTDGPILARRRCLDT